MEIFYALAVAVGIWLLSLSVVLYKVFKKFSLLTRGVEEDLTKKGFAEVRKRLDFLEKDSKNHIQKVGLVRFNPFRELGGDHSFSLAILDGDDSGIIITGLHAREGTRVYVRDIKKGMSNLELSKEEKMALLKTQK